MRTALWLTQNKKNTPLKALFIYTLHCVGRSIPKVYSGQQQIKTQVLKVSVIHFKCNCSQNRSMFGRQLESKSSLLELAYENSNLYLTYCRFQPSSPGIFKYRCCLLKWVFKLVWFPKTRDWPWDPGKPGEKTAPRSRAFSFELLPLSCMY